MGLIKGVLKEELENSVRLKNGYVKALKQYPGGSLIKKRIRGHYYYYWAFREGRKVRFIYKGKELSKEFIVEFEKSKRMRVKYKKLIQELNKRIKYLKKVLHGKEDV
jgi:hypothetical protein